MKKRVVSMLLAVVMMLGMFPGTALAAGSVEEALGEVNIYNGEQKLSYLSINGRVRELIYTYYNYVDRNGQTKEIPAYCVNPNIKGVPQTVAPGESIKYLANEIGSDPKVMGIIANGYPCMMMVMPAGFEPSITSLRGLRPNQLDEGTRWRYGSDSNRRLTALQAVLFNLLSTVSWLG